jgi:hypothetical protein
MSIPRNLGNFADNVNTNGKVEVTGINATGTPSGSTVLFGNSTWASVASSQWTTSGTQIYYNGGDVGIGTATPDAFGKFAIRGGENVAGVGVVSGHFSDASQSSFNFIHSSGRVLATSDTALALGSANVERMRINNSGDILFGTTTSPTTAGGGSAFISDGESRWQLIQNQTTTDPRALQVFRNPNGAIGSIQTGGSSTSYLTSSDYRLKNTITPMTGALAKVALLKPCTYKWNCDGSDSQGFIAHELAEVVPQCVSGEKDALNEDGSIKSQGIDTSFLVATLTAAIQELKAEFDAYKALHP